MKAADLIARHMDAVLRMESADSQHDALEGALLLFRLLEDKVCLTAFCPQLLF